MRATNPTVAELKNLQENQRELINELYTVLPREFFSKEIQTKVYAIVHKLCENAYYIGRKQMMHTDWRK